MEKNTKNDFTTLREPLPVRFARTSNVQFCTALQHCTVRRTRSVTFWWKIQSVVYVTWQSRALIFHAGSEHRLPCRVVVSLHRFYRSYSRRYSWLPNTCLDNNTTEYATVDINKKEKEVERFGAQRADRTEVTDDAQEWMLKMAFLPSFMHQGTQRHSKSLSRHYKLLRGSYKFS